MSLAGWQSRPSQYEQLKGDKSSVTEGILTKTYNKDVVLMLQTISVKLVKRVKISNLFAMPQ